MTILNFTAPHMFSIGGLYTAQESFRKIGDSKIIDVIPYYLEEETNSDYQIRMAGFGIKDYYGIPFPFSLPTNIFYVYDQIKKLNPELIIIHSLFGYHSVIGYFLAKKFSIPYLLVTHGILDPYVFSYRAERKLLWMKLIGQKIINQSKAVICSTSMEATKASSFLKKANVEICPWGVNVPDLSNKNLWRQEIRQQLGIGHGEKILLFLGRLNSMKRPLETAIAFKKLNFPNWKLLIVGYPEDRILFEQINDISINTNVICHQPVEGLNKWKFLASSDAFVLMSCKENFGYAIVEAAFMGLPLLISSGVDTYPYFSSGKAAIISNVNNDECLLDDLSSFLSQSDHTLTLMGANASEVANHHFAQKNFENNLKVIFNKYKQVK